MKTGDCYRVSLKRTKDKYRRSMFIGPCEAIIRLENTIDQWENDKKFKHNNRFLFTVIKMIKGRRWPYNSISINNLKKCGTFDKAATILYGYNNENQKN